MESNAYGGERSYEQYGYGYPSSSDHGRPPPHPASGHYSTTGDWNPSSYRGYGSEQVLTIDPGFVIHLHSFDIITADSRIGKSTHVRKYRESQREWQ
jgi:hypothetical protein